MLRGVGKRVTRLSLNAYQYDIQRTARKMTTSAARLLMKRLRDGNVNLERAVQFITALSDSNGIRDSVLMRIARSNRKDTMPYCRRRDS